MALNHITFYSKLMEMEMGIDVIIPENKWGYSLAERPKDYKYPVLWLLCGGGFDYTDWSPPVFTKPLRLGRLFVLGCRRR